MVQIYQPGRGRKSGAGKSSRRNPAVKSTPVSTSVLELFIDDWDHQGQGVSRSHQPVVFVEGALPGETCKVRITEQKKRVWQGQAIEVLQASAARKTADCEYYAECGGCQTRHIHSAEALKLKQQAVSGLLTKVAGIDELPWQAALVADEYHYRRKTRLALDARNAKLPKLGLRAKGSQDVVGIHHCKVLTPKLDALLKPLQTLMLALQGALAIGHIGLLEGDNLVQVSVRLTRDISQSDRALWQAFAHQNNVQLLFEIRSGEFDKVTETERELVYTLDDGVQLLVAPNDFIQVNAEINRLMVRQALDWLAPQQDENILDLFCGLGNFSLPLAKRCQHVIGVEGVSEMVQRASKNARLNQIANAEFIQMDLNGEKSISQMGRLKIDKVLLDPARDGAFGVMPHLKQLAAQQILYVSCNPASFARDAKLLLEQGYRLDKIGLMDMFPYTSHSELMALFVQTARKR